MHIAALTKQENMQFPYILYVLVLCVFSIAEGGANPSLAKGLAAARAERKDAQRAESDVEDECNPNSVKYQYDHDGSDFEQSECNYYKCNSNKKFHRESCPDGKGVSDFFKNKYNSYGRGQSFDPCTKINTNCKRSLADKGIADIRIPICGIDLAFAVDISCSIEPSDKEKVRRFLLSVLRRMPIRPPFSQCAVLLFSKSVYDIAQLNSFTGRRKLLEVVKNMDLKPKECGTATNLALDYAREVFFNPQNGARPDRKKVLIVVTDGKTHPPQDKPLTLQAAKDNIKANITSYCVALPNMPAGGQLIGQDEWNAIATGNDPDPEGELDPNVFALDSFDKLKEIINEIIGKACMVI